MDFNRQIPFGRPMLGVAETDAVARVLSGPQLVHGPVAAAFEQRFAERCGVAHAVSVSSCTTGLHLILHCLGVGPGDSVVVPAMTHVATAHAVEHAGATPVFADVSAESGNVDPAAAAAAWRADTRGLLAVHYLGLPCAMGALTRLAEARGGWVAEDCALALDATYDGRKAGGLARAGAFSFYPVKHMTTAEGGMVTTDDGDLAARLKKLKAFGYNRQLGERTVPGLYDVDALGFNFRMSEVHAAIGLAQLDRLDAAQQARADNYAALAGALAELDEVIVFAPRQGPAQSSHYCLNAVLPRDGRIDRNRVAAGLNARGVGTSIHYPSAVPLFAHYRGKYGYAPGQFPVAEWLAAQTVSLPVGPHLAPDDPAYIAAAFKEALAEARSERMTTA